MDELNPYAAPQPDPEHRRFARPHIGVRLRQVGAWLLVTLSIVSGLTYTYLDEIVFKTRYGLWPIVFFTAAVSIFSAVNTRELWVAPLSCFLGTVAGDLLAGVLVNWGYAQLHAGIPIAIVFSIPALLLAAFLRKSEAGLRASA